MEPLLSNQVALITGAASGIGRATAELFAREGAAVVLADINDADGEAAAAGIRAAGGDALYVHADVGRMADVEALVAAAHARHGRLDILHSNAFAHVRGDALEITEADWDFTLAVTLKAAWMLAHHALPIMLAGGAGAIVLTGSVHALHGYARYTAYQAAKGGLLALNRSLAVDFAPRVRVNTVLPGAIVTGAWKDVTAEQMVRVAEMCPLQRNAEPEEVANVVLFLASRLSSYMTGAHVVVDGGLLARVKVPDDL
jgi:NAD(P)-dependent dehydrogenase (short-subunit alcohol dehydrogenase family)